jgi:DedD protein
MAKQQTEEELNLKRKARRRLIGAIVLALAVVVILPMVLDSEPKPTGKDIELHIPAANRVGEFIPGVPASEVPEEKILSPVVSEVQATVSPPEPASAIAVVSPAIQVDSAKSAPAKNNQGVATAPSKTEVQGKIQSVVAKQTEIKPPETKKLESKSSAKPDNAENYVVQVGAYANAATAKQELDKLKKWGFKAYTEKTGDKIRVRVGPYPEREKAEKVRQLLEKHDLHPVVVRDK